MLPIFEVLLHASKGSFEDNFIKLKQNLPKQFLEFFQGAQARTFHERVLRVSKENVKSDKWTP